MRLVGLGLGIGFGLGLDSDTRKTSWCLTFTPCDGVASLHCLYR